VIATARVTMTTHSVGIGARAPHYAALVENAPPLGFVEVHSENFFADGGASIAVLQQLHERYPVSLHGVGLALGSAAGLDAWHLERLERLVQRVDPVRVSDHACFARAPRTTGGPVLHGSDLLPIAFTEASLAILVRNVVQVQERLRRPIAVENLSAYVAFPDDTIPEAQFLAELVRRSGCTLLLDLNNLMVNALNAGAADPLASCRAFVDALPAGCVDEIHLAGYGETADIVIDDHGSRVRPAVWQLYRHAIARLGAVPTLIEWDTDVPALEVLLDQAAQAQRFVDEAAP
jgi:uncharacterized protein (UPF0276 family)